MSEVSPIGAPTGGGQPINPKELQALMARMQQQQGAGGAAPVSPPPIDDGDSDTDSTAGVDPTAGASQPQGQSGIPPQVLLALLEAQQKNGQAGGAASLIQNGFGGQPGGGIGAMLGNQVGGG